MLDDNEKQEKFSSIVQSSPVINHYTFVSLAYMCAHITMDLSPGYYINKIFTKST